MEGGAWLSSPNTAVAQGVYLYTFAIRDSYTREQTAAAAVARSCFDPASIVIVHQSDERQHEDIDNACGAL